MELSDTRIFQTTRKQVFNPLPDGAVILDMGNGVYYTLNEIGTLIWKHLQQPQNIRTLHELIVAEYDVSPEDLQADLNRFIEKLLASQLIEVVNEHPG